MVKVFQVQASKSVHGMLRAANNVRPKTQERIDMFARKFAKKAVKDIKAVTPVGTGDLRNSTKYRINHYSTRAGYPTTAVVVFQDAFRNTDTNDFFYARARQRGSRPANVPFQNLMPWVQAKFGLKGRQATYAAYYLAKAIATEGLKGYNYLREPIGNLKQYVASNYQSNMFPKSIRKYGGF